MSLLIVKILSNFFSLVKNMAQTFTRAIFLWNIVIPVVLMGLKKFNKRFHYFAKGHNVLESVSVHNI